MPRSRYHVVHPQHPHFITATVNNWLPLFTRPETMDIVLDCWRFLQLNNNLEIFGYVILENHLHLIARSTDINRDIRRFKSYTAREIVAYLEKQKSVHLLRLLAFFKRKHKVESTYQVWEEGNHPQVITREEVLRQKLDYIHQNPIKRGYVDAPEHWRYSSARNYAGQAGLIEVFTGW